MNFFTSFFTDNNPEKLRSALKRIWLDDFLSLCQSVGGETGEQMTRILMFTADCKTLQIVYNSLWDDNLDMEERHKMCPTFG